MSASTSAQETVPGQAASSLALIRCTEPNPRSVWFGGASFSAVLLAVESISTDPSQPCIINENNKMFQNHIDSSTSSSFLHAHQEQYDQCAYPDEAVVEMEAEERAGEGGGDGEDPDHLLPHDLLHLGARLAVEPHVQLRHRRRARRQDHR
ncbi:Os11g0661700, partial [Oryza sativa Japonica Group]